MSTDDGPGHGPPSVEASKVKRIIQVLLLICTAVVVADFFYDKHGHYGVEKIVGFHALYGFVSCVLLVIVATAMRKVVMRDEDWYDRD